MGFQESCTRGVVGDDMRPRLTGGFVGGLVGWTVGS
jgi:hypothetical protein